MFLSYLVTCHNETDSLEKLLSKLIEYKKNNHEIVLLDDYSDNPETLEIIQKFKEKVNFQQHKLDKNYGNHKNYGIKLCKGEWIFQLDADEVPTDGLLENIDLIIGGHTHTFLDKPTVVKNKAGKDVLVNQVGCYGINLGRIDFYFDNNKQNIAKGKSIVV